MLACARLGVIHSEVFGGFSGAACGQRMADAKSTILVTMDAYYRNGELIDHKVKADEAIEAARKEGHRGREGARVAAAPGRVPLREPDGRGARLLRRRAARRLPGPGGRAGVDAGRGHAVPDVHERHDRPPEGRAALDRRLPGLRHRHVEVLPGHPSRRHVLVLRRHRLDHRPLLHRLRAAGARDDERHVRGRADLSGRGAARGGSPRSSAWTSSTPRRRRSGCCASSARTSRPSTTTTSRR